MEILSSAKSTEENSISTFLIVLFRGGLWVITENMQKVFVITGKYFSVQSAAIGLHKLSTPTLVNNSITFPPLSLTLHHTVSDCNTSVNEGVEIKILWSIFTL